MIKSDFKKNLAQIVRVGLLEKIIQMQTVAIFNSDCSEKEFYKIKVDELFYSVITEILVWNKNQLDKEDELKKNIETTFLKFLNANFEIIKNEVKESVHGIL